MTFEGLIPGAADGGRRLRRLLATGLAGALTGAAAVSPAAAGDAGKLRMEVHGFVERWLGVADNDDGFQRANGPFSEFNIVSDGEIRISGKKVLDNGLEVVVKVQFDTQTSVQQIQESYVELTLPAWGVLQLGSVDNAATKGHVSAPDVGIGAQDGDTPLWVRTPRTFSDGTITYFSPFNPKARKISYYSPEYAGFSFGTSYTPDLQSTATIPTGDVNSAWSAVVMYKRQDESGAWIFADLGYGHADKSATSNSSDVWQAGLLAGYGAWSVGGSLALLGADREGEVAGTFLDGYIFDVGVSWKRGALATSLVWLHSVAEGSNAIDADDRRETVQASAALDLGPGVALKGSLFWMLYDDETSLPANNNEGFGGVLGMVVQF
ncbi:MAG: porin [Hyphomicrobiales bacterium]|nr:porin [Hyphomicrobiales bacterium]